MKKTAWIRLLGLVGLVFILFGMVSIFNTADDPLFRNISLSQMGFGVLLCLVYVVSSFSETVAALLRNKEKLLGALAGIFILILVIGINIISQSHLGEIKWDVTKNKIHTLDKASIDILKNLPNEVEILSFVSDPRLRPLFDGLSEKYKYQTSKISYRTLDAKKDPKLLKQYEAREGQIVFVNKKTNKTVSLDARQINEQEFTSALRRVMGETGKKVYFITWNKDSPLEDQSESGLFFLKFLLEREGFQVDTLNLLENTEMPKDASLVVLWTSTPTPAPVVQSLITYADAGGRLIIGQDPILNPARDGLTSHNLDLLLKKFGLEIPNSIVVQLRPALAIRERSGQKEIVRTGTQRLVRVVGLGDTGHPVVEPLKSEIFDFIFALPVVQNKAELPNTERLVVTQTGEASIVESSIKKLLETEEVSKENIKGTGPYALAQSSVIKLSKPGPFGSEAKLIAFGNADFGRNANIKDAANADLLLNAFNFLSDSKDGLMIRPKSWTPSTLKVSEETRIGVYFASIFLLPMLIIIFGLSVWNFRRSRT